jgi:hypothetical protein
MLRIILSLLLQLWKFMIQQKLLFWIFLNMIWRYSGLQFVIILLIILLILRYSWTSIHFLYTDVIIWNVTFEGLNIGFGSLINIVSARFFPLESDLTISLKSIKMYYIHFSKCQLCFKWNWLIRDHSPH